MPTVKKAAAKAPRGTFRLVMGVVSPGKKKDTFRYVRRVIDLPFVPTEGLELVLEESDGIRMQYTITELSYDVLSDEFVSLYQTQWMDDLEEHLKVGFVEELVTYSGRRKQ